MIRSHAQNEFQLNRIQSIILLRQFITQYTVWINNNNLHEYTAQKISHNNMSQRKRCSSIYRCHNMNSYNRSMSQCMSSNRSNSNKNKGSCCNNSKFCSTSTEWNSSMELQLCTECTEMLVCMILKRQQLQPPE